MKKKITLRKNIIKCEIFFAIKEKQTIHPKLTIDLSTMPDTYKKLTISAYIIQGKHELMGGQCIDGVLEYFGDEQRIKKLVEIWKRWHLNGLNAGTRTQNSALKKCTSTDYTERLNFLEKLKLSPDRGYVFGSAWLVEIIPEDVIEEIKNFVVKNFGPPVEG